MLDRADHEGTEPGRERADDHLRVGGAADPIQDASGDAHIRIESHEPVQDRPGRPGHAPYVEHHDHRHVEELGHVGRAPSFCPVLAVIQRAHGLEYRDISPGRP